MNSLKSHFGYFTLILALAFGYTASGQYQLNGTATKIGSHYRLTEDKPWQTGSMWYTTQLNLNISFDVIFELYFGNHDDGADGITFTLQRKGVNAGEAGGGLGASNITPSLIVEYDTYQNTVNPWDATDFKDPVYDHITIGRDSFAADHSKAPYQLAAPVQANAGSTNIEDGQWHSTRVTWNATTKTLDVYFDCALRNTYTGDIVNTVFAGNPLVYYGFTASTGGANNEHSVRGFRFGGPKNITAAICKGDSVQVDLSGDQNYSWTPNTNISDITSANPYLFPAISTQYIANISNCYLNWNDTVNITVNNLPTPNLTNKEICIGDPAATFNAGADYTTYLWSNNGSGSNPTTSGTAAGNYTVTVGDAKGCKATTTATLTVNTLPSIQLANDTTICENGVDQLTLKASYSDSCQLSWSTAENNVDSILIKKPGTYSVTVIDTKSCKNSDEISVSELCPDFILKWPNIITPNGDGSNDGFRTMNVEETDVNYIMANIEIISFEVYDRWGILMFGSDDNVLPYWDGTYNGKVAAPGTYYFIVKYTTTSGRAVEVPGYMTLL